MKRLRWLVWKEYRQNRLLVVAGLVLLFLPYVLALLGGLVGLPFLSIAVTSGFISLLASLLTLALVGGNSIAGERADRSAEFLFSLPFSRWERLAAKLLFVALVVGVTCLTNLSIISMAGGSREARGAAFAYLFYGVMIFGVAWFASSMSASRLLSVYCGIATPFVFLLSFAAADWLFGDATKAQDKIAAVFLTEVVLAVLGFAIGTWRYLRRIEP